MFTSLFGLLSYAMFINKIQPSSCSFYFENLKYNNVLLFFSRVFFFNLKFWYTLPTTRFACSCFLQMKDITIDS
jgi:hypothetical protein